MDNDKLAQECGCPEFTASRRTFLRGVAGAFGAGAVTSVIGDVHRQVAFGATVENPNVLVVVSLRGGADGLSLVVPHGDPHYAAARPRIAIPTAQLLGSDAMFGLHPGFAPLLPMWNAGSFGAVHAVGLPQPNRSHFAAMEALEDADPGSSERRGWINRMVGLIPGEEPQQATELGSPMVPGSLYGVSPALSLTKLASMQLSGSQEADFLRRHRIAYDMLWGNRTGPLGRGAQSAVATTESLSDLATTPINPQNGASYPSGDLGQALAETATLIRANVGTRVVTLDCGSWDMHSGLGTLQWGGMQSNVDELSNALAAFFTDLGGSASQVTVVSITEFGRRVTENGHFGLDHGWGSAVLLLGAGVRGGQVHGNWPGLAESALVDGDLAVTRDYRSVLTEVVRSRFPELNSSQVFPGFVPETIGAMTLG